jgi:hypothetical protein
MMVVQPESQPITQASSVVSDIRHDITLCHTALPAECYLQAGEFLLVGLAYALPAWKHLLLAGACINIACLLAYPLTLESARWLLSQGRMAEATAILQHTARANKTAMPAQLLAGSLPAATEIVIEEEAVGELAICKDAAAEEGRGADSKQSVDAPPGVWEVLRQRQLAFRLAVLLLNWFALYLSYYGITVASGILAGSV